MFEAFYSTPISKRYFRKCGEANYFDAVKPMSLVLEPGTVTMMGGRSGSGKTTVLHMLCGLLKPSKGRVTLDGTDLYALSDAALSKLRNDLFGVVPQGHSAIDTLTVLENILLPGALYNESDRLDIARKWMEVFGIAHLSAAFPAELSGGELRRMALARAFTTEPDILFADEPTGDLDDENTAVVLSALHQFATEEGKIVFLVTHEDDASRIADRIFKMDAGVLTD